MDNVEFVVEGCRIVANRKILAERSEYFRALLYNGLSESLQQEIKLEVPLEAFKCLLDHIYNGTLSTQINEENVLDTLGLADQYCLSKLKALISDYLTQIVSVENVCSTLEAARLYNLAALQNVCHSFVDRNATEMIIHESFRNLSQETLCGILERDSFFVPEALIFASVRTWCEENWINQIESVLSKVRLPLMSFEELEDVRLSGIISPGRIQDAIAEKTASKTLRYRGQLLPEQNVAAPRFGSTINGFHTPEVLEDNHGYYDVEKGYAWHMMSDSNDSGIVVELGSTSIINHIKLLLWDRDNRSYCYFIEVSVDRKQWDRVVDYRGYYCRSWQYLYFTARPVRYMKLVGTHNTENKVFQVVLFNAKYTGTVPTLMNGIISPVENVATVEFGASVVKGISRIKNHLITAKVANCSYQGCTSHKIGHGEIMIQLGQPYIISSLRFCLYSLLASRNSSFYIETSLDSQNWAMAVDKREELCESWQQFSFESRPVSFIKIVGTFTSTTEFFSIIRFDCPVRHLNETR